VRNCLPVCSSARRGPTHEAGSATKILFPVYRVFDAYRLSDDTEVYAVCGCVGVWVCVPQDSTTGILATANLIRFSQVLVTESVRTLFTRPLKTVIVANVRPLQKYWLSGCLFLIQ
jgi:hypothetical protein